MRSRRIISGPHLIEFRQPDVTDKDSVWEEIVVYDGQEKCRDKTVMGGSHRFSVMEDEASVEYVLTYSVPFVIGKGKLTVKRNGQTIYEED